MVHDLMIFIKYKNKERFVGVYNWREPQLLITDPKLGKDVLITHFKNFHDNTISKSINKESDPLFSEHPFTLTGEEWKSGRQLISPSLNSNRIRAYYPIIEETSKRLVNFLNKTCKNPPKDGLEAKELAMMYTLDIVGAGVYGIDSGTFSEDHPTE
uniref:Cytochrome P450 n=1 Tax=Megaselia scalaris TaxID=36166 RepID=T1GAY1_MEGSC